MLISLQGTITHKDFNFLILENAGVGYKIYFTEMDKALLNQDTKIFIHEYIREDKYDLYGFLSLEEMSFFLKLLSVSGVGPKSAQNILSLGMDKVQKSIMEGSATLVESVSGIGKKTAQKVVLELRGSIDKILSRANVNQDVLNALIGLGYNRKEATEVLEDISAEISGEEAQIKAALKLLAK